MSNLTKEEFLSRCENAYDAGLCGKEQLNLLYLWIDFVMRFEGGQIHEVARFLQSELNRNGVKSTGAISKMAGDKIGYDITKWWCLILK